MITKEEDIEIVQKGMKNGEKLLTTEYKITEEAAMALSQLISESNQVKKVIKTDNNQACIENRPKTPNLLQVTGMDEKSIPSTLQSRPKIPRTPVNPERLKKIREENDEV